MTGVEYSAMNAICDIAKIKKNDPNYWTRLEHQYVGMAMQGLMSHIKQVTPTKDHSYCDEIVDFSIAVAHALVEKLKEE